MILIIAIVVSIALLKLYWIMPQEAIALGAAHHILLTFTFLPPSGYNVSYRIRFGEMEPTIQIKLLETDEGKVPFEEWYDSLKDKVTKVRVRRRLDRLELGNLGDTQPVGEGVYELRLHFGAGYRIYFTRVGNTVIVLLGGGDKRTQKNDITKAKDIWKRYKHEAQRYARKLGS